MPIKKVQLYNTCLHFMAYMDMTKNIAILLDFLLKNKIYFPPSENIFEKSIFDIATFNKNSSLLEVLVSYYGNKNIAEKSFLSCSLIFTKSIKKFMNMRIRSLPKLLNSRIYKIQGNLPDFGEKTNDYLIKSKTIIFFLF